MTENSDSFTVRPGGKVLHKFRSRIVNMEIVNGRLWVALASGYIYRSNKAMTRWYRVQP